MDVQTHDKSLIDKQVIPRMAGLPGYDRAAAAIWLHEKP